MQQSCMTQSFYPGMTSVDPIPEVQGQQTGGLIPIISMEKTQTINIQIKNDDMLPGPEVGFLLPFLLNIFIFVYYSVYKSSINQS